MKRSINNRLWAASLTVLAAAVLAQFGLQLAGVALPDTAVRLLGAAYLAALPVLGFTTVRKLRGKAGKEERSHRNGGQ